MITAEIITIGDEILYGQIIDTNAQWLSQELDTIGVKTIRRTTIGDNENDIVNTLTKAEEKADIILITGGLGPTSDDLTKPTLAKYFNSTLSLNKEVLEDIKTLLKVKNRTLNTLNEQQAIVPDLCTVIRNKLGTAPGMWFEKDQKVVVSMPGVPYEMKAMFLDGIIPKLKSHFDTPIIKHKIIKTTGIGESSLAPLIENWEKELPPYMSLAYLPSLGEVKLRITTTGESGDLIDANINYKVEELKGIIEQYIYGYDDDTLQKVIGKILIKQQSTLATAESCTGGSVAKCITSVPGSSSYFMGSVVAYSNMVKQKILGVNPTTLANYGAISEEVVVEMSNGVREKLNTDIGIATSGIAGPEGGTEEKPVGTIWLAIADGKSTETRKLSLNKNRELNVEYTTVAALNMLWNKIHK